MPIPADPAGFERLAKRTGRINVKVINHPEFGTGWVKRSHLVYWEHYGTRIPRGYVLHHKDGDRTNDNIRNLKLMTNAAHTTHHQLGNTPWNKGKRGLQTRLDQSQRNRERIWTKKAKKSLSRIAKTRPRDAKGRLQADDD